MSKTSASMEQSVNSVRSRFCMAIMWVELLLFLLGYLPCSLRCSLSFRMLQGMSTCVKLIRGTKHTIIYPVDLRVVLVTALAWVISQWPTNKSYSEVQGWQLCTNKDTSRWLWCELGHHDRDRRVYEAHSDTRHNSGDYPKVEWWCC